MNKTVLFALHRLSCLKLEEKIKLGEACPAEEDFLKLNRFEAEWLLGRRLRCLSFIPSEMMELAKRDRDNARERGISFTAWGDEDYPGLLKEIYDPPLILFWKGCLPPRDRAALAVVGTRKPSLEADRSAFRLGLEAAGGNIPLVSGMASGIDGSSHKGVLALSGKTWAVLGTGCDKPYPSVHRRMAGDIISCGGGLLSEFFPGTEPARYNFPKRNRIISGLSSHVIIVQAPRRSGALYTADFALDQGREVCVHESGLAGKNSEGSRELAEQGARVIQKAGDIYSAINEPYRTMGDSFGLSRGSCADAGRLTARLLRDELQGSLVFYKGRTQAHG